MNNKKKIYFFYLLAIRWSSLTFIENLCKPVMSNAFSSGSVLSALSPPFQLVWLAVMQSHHQDESKLSTVISKSSKPDLITWHVCKKTCLQHLPEQRNKSEAQGYTAIHAVGYSAIHKDLFYCLNQCLLCITPQPHHIRSHQIITEHPYTNLFFPT